MAKKKSIHLITCLIAALAVFSWLGLGFAEAAGNRPSFTAKSPDTISPRFGWKARTYAARCRDGDLTLQLSQGRGWTTQVGDKNRRRDSYTTRTRLSEGQAVRIRFRKKIRNRKARIRTFWIRCLPDDFPSAPFKRYQSGGPQFFTVGRSRYATVFNRNGTPVWWYRVSGSAADTKILADKTFAWNNNSAGVGGGEIEVRNLSGKLIRTIDGGGIIDIHDIQLLPSGNYLYAKVDNFKGGIDLSQLGGPSDALVQGGLIQETTPDGENVWSWDSNQAFGIDETPLRWGSYITNRSPLWYDTSHWNAVERKGKFIYLSYRHLDAIYKVDRISGEIVWKLGGTKTDKSLKVLDDPLGDYPLGGNHDVRVQPNDTVTVFDNRTGLADRRPRAVRYRINESNKTARLVESIQDPTIEDSPAAGSARRLPSKEWLVSWGGNFVNSEPGTIGVYDQKGKPIWRMRASSYRANPVPEGVVRMVDLRRAMNRMNR